MYIVRRYINMSHKTFINKTETIAIMLLLYIRVQDKWHRQSIRLAVEPSTPCLPVTVGRYRLSAREPEKRRVLLCNNKGKTLWQLPGKRETRWTVKSEDCVTVVKLQGLQLVMSCYSVLIQQIIRYVKGYNKKVMFRLFCSTRVCRSKSYILRT